MGHREVLEAMSGLLLALLVAILSSTIVSNALPTIVADLHGTQGQYTWVVTATLLASTATTPIWGKLSDLFSKKLLYQVAIGVFTLGSVLSGFSQSMGALIGFRTLQGVGMGGLQALAQVIIAAMVSPRERGRYNGYTGAVMAVATVGGPLVGGVIVDTSWLGWRWCFFVVVPLAVLALAVLSRTLHLPVVRRKARIDWAGATLITGGVSLLLIWVSFAGKDFAWWSLSTLAYLAGALACVVLALVVESRVAEPVIPLHLFRNRTTVLAVLASVAVGTAMFGTSVFLGQYFQLSRGYSPTEAGLLSLPMVAGLFAASTVSGQVISRTGKWKAFLVAGSLLLVTGLGLLGTVDHETSLWVIGCFLVLVGLGIGMTMQNLVLAVQNTVGPRELGAASSVVTFFRSLGGAAGVSVLGSVLATRVTELVNEGLSRLPRRPGATGGSGGLAMDIGHMPEPVRGIVRAAYGDATGRIFLIAGIVAVVTVVTVVFIKEVPLRTSAGGAPQPEAAPRVGQPSATPSVHSVIHRPVDEFQGNVDNSAPTVDNSLRRVGELGVTPATSPTRANGHAERVDDWYARLHAHLAEFTSSLAQAGRQLTDQATALRAELDAAPPRVAPPAPAPEVDQEARERLLAEARHEAERIVAAAREESERLRREAERQAEELVASARARAARVAASAEPTGTGDTADTIAWPEAPVTASASRPEAPAGAPLPQAGPQTEPGVEARPEGAGETGKAPRRALFEVPRAATRRESSFAGELRALFGYPDGPMNGQRGPRHAAGK
ncbi:MDR family MFS transporter [Streptoalloteichus tenebrarius]|nr:MDR family MFS transporter [Streptoalloteichus tenebrarius]